MTEAESEMVRDAYRFLNRHIPPPPCDGSQATRDWWMKTARDVGDLVGQKWHDHRLITELMISMMNYLEQESKGVSIG